MAAADRILSIVAEPHMPDYMKLLSLQAQVLQSVLSTQARVDDSRLRTQAGDKFGEILDRIKKGI